MALEILAAVRFTRRSLRRLDAFLEQVVIRARLRRASVARGALVGAVAILALAAHALSQTVPVAPAPTVPSVTQIDVRDITDFALATGNQVAKSRFDQLMSDRDIRAAAMYFSERRLRVQPEGIVDARFRRISTKDTFSVSVIPFVPTTGPQVQGAPQHLVMMVRNNEKKLTKIAAGSIVAEGRDLVVREDNAVGDGRVFSGQGFLKAFVKCALPGCIAATYGCFLTPGWLPCFCAGCGVNAVACAALEVFFP